MATEVTGVTKGNRLVARSGYANVHGDEIVLVTGAADWGAVGFFVAEEFIPDAERIARGSEPGPRYFPKVFCNDKDEALRALAVYCRANLATDHVDRQSVVPLDPKILELRQALDECRTALFKATRRPATIQLLLENDKLVDAALERAQALIGSETMPELAA